MGYELYRRDTLQLFVWPVFVVAEQLLAGSGLDLFEIGEQMHIEHLASAGPVKALDEGILTWRAWLDISDGPMVAAHEVNTCETSSGPLSRRIASGAPGSLRWSRSVCGPIGRSTRRRAEVQRPAVGHPRIVDS